MRATLGAKENRSAVGKNGQLHLRDAGFQKAESVSRRLRHDCGLERMLPLDTPQDVTAAFEPDGPPR